MKHLLQRSLLALCFLPLIVQAVIPDIRFRRLDTRDGLSNSQVNAILRDSKGFMWLPTPFGLCRYDGYRFRTFYSFEHDTTTIRSNRVMGVMEAYDGRLWLDHGMNYAVYDPITETVERWPTKSLAEYGITGGTEHLYIDPERLFGLIGRGEIEETYYRGEHYLTDYDFARYAKKRALEKARVTFSERFPRPYDWSLCWLKANSPQTETAHGLDTIR